MVWQDTSLLLLNLVFGFIQIPQIRYLYRTKSSMSLASTGITVAGLMVFGIVYATLHFWLGVFGDAIDVTAWAALFILSVKYRG
jgi:hypothetical protein